MALMSCKEAREILCYELYDEGHLEYLYDEIETAIHALRYHTAIEIKDDCICPNCSSYNETIKKRMNTVKSDTCHCWHCGQTLKF